MTRTAHAGAGLPRLPRPVRLYCLPDRLESGVGAGPPPSYGRPSHVYIRRRFRREVPSWHRPTPSTRRPRSSTCPSKSSSAGSAASGPRSARSATGPPSGFRSNEIDELARSYGLGSSDELPLAEGGGPTDDPTQAPAPAQEAPLQLDDSDETFQLTSGSGTGQQRPAQGRQGGQRRPPGEGRGQKAGRPGRRGVDPDRGVRDPRGRRQRQAERQVRQAVRLPAQGRRLRQAQAGRAAGQARPGRPASWPPGRPASTRPGTRRRTTRPASSSCPSTRTATSSSCRWPRTPARRSPSGRCRPSRPGEQEVRQQRDQPEPADRQRGVAGEEEEGRRRRDRLRAEPGRPRAAGRRPRSCPAASSRPTRTASSS